ncbi:50S ribosomal protein L18 [Limihaloglobus sulfuriphilus]|nr:50S ribosomal protein L18 [Limihaloglobus sulfuriphilus]
MKVHNLRKTRFRRKMRVRNKTVGTADTPRLSVFRSNRHMYAQIIDDSSGVTLASVNTNQKSVAGGLKSLSNVEAAARVGEELGKQALKVGIQKVKFDRNRFKYHGRVKALADSARKAGLIF